MLLFRGIALLDDLIFARINFGSFNEIVTIVTVDNRLVLAIAGTNWCIRLLFKRKLVIFVEYSRGGKNKLLSVEEVSIMNPRFKGCF